MVFKRILLFFIVVTALKLISAEMLCAVDVETDDIFTYGDDTQIIQDWERAQFHITNDQVMEAVKKEMGATPENVWVKSPTEYGDLYTIYGWPQVKRTYSPLYGEVLSKDVLTGVLARQMCENHLSIPLECSATLTQTVTNTVTHTRSRVHDLTTGLDVGYKFNLGVGEINGKFALNYKTSWTNSHTESSAVTLGSTAAIKYTLAPGKKAVAKLEAKQGIMLIRVHYAGSLSGMVTMNYSWRHQGHYFWGNDIDLITDQLSRPRRIETQEDILIEFFTEARIVVSDLTTNEIIKRIDIPVDFPILSTNNHTLIVRKGVMAGDP